MFARKLLGGLVIAAATLVASNAAEMIPTFRSGTTIGKYSK